MSNQDNLKQFRFDEPASSPMADALVKLKKGDEKVLAKITLCPKHHHDHHHHHDCDHDQHSSSNKWRHSDDIVWFSATVGWRAKDENGEGLVVKFRIRKGSGENGTVVFATKDGVGSDEGELGATTTSFVHVQESPFGHKHSCHHHDHDTEYVLTAELVKGGSQDKVLIVGPIVFTAAVID